MLLMQLLDQRTLYIARFGMPGTGLIVVLPDLISSPLSPFPLFRHSERPALVSHLSFAFATHKFLFVHSHRFHLPRISPSHMLLTSGECASGSILVALVVIIYYSLYLAATRCEVIDPLF